MPNRATREVNPLDATGIRQQLYRQMNAPPEELLRQFAEYTPWLSLSGLAPPAPAEQRDEQ